MSLPFDIFGVIGASVGASVVARVYFPTGLVSAGLVVTPTDDPGSPLTIAEGSTYFDLMLIESPDGIYGRSATLSTLPSTSGRPYTIEVRESATTLDITDPSEWEAAFDAATEILVARQALDGTQLGGFVASGAWSIDGKAASGGGGTVGPGADPTTVRVRVGSTNIADADVWVTTDADGTSVVAGPLRTNSDGKATFMLDTGASYYLWAQKNGVNAIQGEPFTGE